MGMYDSIRIPVAWCPYCGHKFENEFWQTKTGEYEKLSCASHDTISAFAEHMGFLGVDVEVHHICPDCKEYVSVVFPNEWEMAERAREQSLTKWFKEWEDKDTSRHPNHEIGSYRGHGESLIIGWSIGHCVICKERGQDAEQDIPDMDPGYRERLLAEKRAQTEEWYNANMQLVTRWRHESRQLTMEELDQIINGLPMDTQFLIRSRAEEIFGEDTDGES